MLVATAAAAMGQIPTPLPYSQSAVSQPAATAAPATAMAMATAPSGGATAGIFGGWVPDETYKLRPGDTVSFQIREDLVWNPQDLPKSLVVTDSGELDVPYIGRVTAVDKTCKQVATDIKTALEKDYYQKATVEMSLNVANRIMGRVYISGEVHTPGPLDMQVNENLTAAQAIMRAGGLNDFADKKHVKVVRASVTSNGGKPFDLDMEQILNEGKTEKDIVLQPGDLLIVPTRLINF